MEHNSIQTVHYINRSKKRVRMNNKRAIRMAELAWNRGYRMNDCHWSEDKKYLLEKTNEGIEAIAYNGFCYIFSKNELKCITVYKLPKDFGRKKTKYYKSKVRKIKNNVYMEELL